MRTLVPALVLIAALPLAACATRQPAELPAPEPEVEQAPAEIPVVEIVPLQNSRARELHSVLSATFRGQRKMLGRDGPTIVSDARTNSLILYGLREDRERAKGLIAALDI